MTLTKGTLVWPERTPIFGDSGIEVMEGIFPDRDFVWLRDQLRASVFIPYHLDKPQVLYLAPVSDWHDQWMTRCAEMVVGRPLRQIKSFARLNTENLDTAFRVHSDGRIYGRYPDVACVYFIDTRDDSGTAFYENEKYGRRCEPSKDGLHQIFKEDDGLWHPYAKVTQKENSMLVYDAKLFHGRFPWKSYGKDQTDGRIVVVKFLEYKPGA